MVILEGFGKSDQTQKVQNTALLIPPFSNHVVYCNFPWGLPQHLGYTTASCCRSLQIWVEWAIGYDLLIWSKNDQHHNGSLHNNRIVPKKRPLNWIWANVRLNEINYVGHIQWQGSMTKPKEGRGNCTNGKTPRQEGLREIHWAC